MKKLVKRAVSLGLALVLAMTPITVSASTNNFRDVGATHWAAQAIGAVSDLGIMTGDFSGNFNPYGTIDKFEAVRIFTRMAGFNPATHTAAQTAYYNGVFEQRRAVIEGFSNTLVTWNSQMNREIAYLMYREILRPADLGNFITVQNGVETRRILNREEAAVFLVRFMGAESTALTTFGVPLFLDDHLISPAMRPHVYFLRSLGILNGSQGNVSPRQPVNRAAMAALIQSTLNEISSPLIGGSAGNTQVQGVTTINGTITNTFQPLRSILATVGAENRIMPIANNAIITVNGINATFNDLAMNMTFTAILNGNDIISINAAAAGQQSGGTNTNTNTPNVDQMRVLDGTVARVNVAERTIGIETRTINPRGEIVTEIRDYNVPTTAAITRGGPAVVNFNTIAVGDLVVARVHGDSAYVVTLEERVRQVSGTLVEKIFGANSLFPTIVIEDADGANHSFAVNSSATINRGNQRNLNSRQLRIGDSVELWAENGVATTIQARANAQAFRDVYVRDIFISGRGQSFIIISEDLTGAPDSTHFIIDGMVDPFEINLGARVRIWFDSQEIVGISTLAGPTSTNFTGHIQNITQTQLVMRDSNFQTRTFTFDNSTVFVNSVTGQIINVHHLSIGMRLQIVSANTQNNRAVSVTVLAN